MYLGKRMKIVGIEIKVVDKRGEEKWRRRIRGREGIYIMNKERVRGGRREMRE